jgi:hypothetical protein
VQIRSTGRYDVHHNHAAAVPQMFRAFCRESLPRSWPVFVSWADKLHGGRQARVAVVDEHLDAHVIQAGPLDSEGQSRCFRRPQAAIGFRRRRRGAMIVKRRDIDFDGAIAIQKRNRMVSCRQHACIEQTGHGGGPSAMKRRATDECGSGAD